MSTNKRVFDTNVQIVKYNVLKEVIRRAYEGGLEEAYYEIPKVICPGPKPQIRCCIYKERTIIQDRIKLAMGGDKNNPNPVEVIDIACDECPAQGVMVTPACRGCMVHACQDVCPKGAISIVNQRAVVDKEKCIECGKCSKACPYSAIIMQHRPCMVSCKVKAITIDENKKAKIDNDKCISCGACVYKCPFGAITDKSYVLDIIDMLKKSENNTKYKVYAVIAPAIVSQCRFGRPTQVVTAIQKLGFHQVVEAALGADITLYHEALEWKEKGLMTTSCCPSYMEMARKHAPELQKYISTTYSPMIYTADIAREKYPNAKLVFVGPCIAKRKEARREDLQGKVDFVLTYEEVHAILGGMNIELGEANVHPVDCASRRSAHGFAENGGVTAAVKELVDGKLDFTTLQIAGLNKKNVGLLKAYGKTGKAPAQFIEVMVCDGGCISGPSVHTAYSDGKKTFDAELKKR